MTGRTIVHRVGLAVLLSAGLSLPVLAQGVGAIGGTITDESGAVMPGATVTLSSPGLIGGNQETVSDGRGVYQFIRLVPGRYSVKAELQGFRPVIQENITVDADQTSRADLKLAVGQLSEEMTITGAAPLLDTTSALNQTVMSRDVLDTLPGRNDLWSVGRLTPGVLMNKYDVGGVEVFQQSQAKVHGSISAENSFLIDGMDTNFYGAAGGSSMSYYIDTFSAQEINYSTGNTSAERNTGGVIYNVITKTGTNAFQGAYMFTGANHGMSFDNVNATLRTQLLASVPPAALAAKPDIKPGADIQRIFDTAVTYSGPITRDRLWFSGTAKVGELYQYRLGSYNSDGTQLLDDNLSRTIQGKLSWQSTKNSQLHWMHGLSERGTFHKNGNSQTDFFDTRATNRNDSWNNLDVARWTNMLSSHMVADAGFSRLAGQNAMPPQPDVKQGDVARFDSVLKTHTVALPTYSTGPRGTRINFVADLGYSASNHDIRVGYQFVRSHNGAYNYSLSNYPAGLQAVFANGVPTSVNTYNTPNEVIQYFHDNSIYAQDKWTPIHKLTLNLGVRFDTTYGWQPETCQVETVFIAGQCYAALNGYPDWKRVIPRVSAIYDVFGDGKTALKFSVNRYDIPPGVPFVNQVNPVKLVSDTRAWTVCAAGQASGCDLNGDRIPQVNELGPSTGFASGTTNRYATDVKWPYSDEYSAEIEQQLPGQVVVSIGYFHRSQRLQIGSRNLLVPTSSYTPITVTEVSSGRTVTVYNQDATLRGKFDTLFTNAPELDGDFNGVDISASKRMANGWSLMGGFSAGKSTGDIYGTSDLNNPNFTFRHGVLVNDAPMSAKISAAYQLPYGIGLSGSYQGYVGFPEQTTVLVNAQTVRLTQVSQSIVVDPAGTTRLPNINAVDMSLRKAFRMGHIKLEPVADIYNLFNIAAVQSRVTQLGPAYGQAANILRGRLIRLGGNVNW